MTLPLWGLLQKSQDDTSTIDEAIAAAIVEHEEDPTAHLGEGESLSEHKHESVIDHPPLSVVTDKIPDQSVPPVKFDISGFYYQTTFESLDNWVQQVNGGGSWLFPYPAILNFRIGATSGAYARIYQLSPYVIEDSTNPYFQFRLRADSTEEEYGDFAAGFTNSTNALSPSGDCFSFFWDASAMQMYARVTDGGSNTDEPISVDFTSDWVLLRAEFDDTEGEIRFYVDGTLVHTADASGLNIQFDYIFSAALAAWSTLPVADFYMSNLIIGHS